MLQCTISKRPSAEECLSHHFFTHKTTPNHKDLLLLPTRILRLLDVTKDIDLEADEEEYSGQYGVVVVVVVFGVFFCHNFFK